MNNTSFKPTMFVYSVDTVINPTELKVYIPEVFLDMETNKIRNTTLPIGSKNIYINNTKPTVSKNILTRNYITLKVSGISGEVKKGDRLIAIFINNNPLNGVIISRS